MNARLSDLLIAVIGAPIAAALNTDSNSTRLDMAGYEGVIFIASITDSVATGVATLKVEENDIDSDTGMAALAGATATVTCTVNDDLNGKALAVEVYQPRERYVQAVRTSTVANIAFGDVIAIRYGAKKLPITVDGTIAASASVASPAQA